MRSMFYVVLIAGVGLASMAVMMVKDYISGYQAALAEARAERGEMIQTVDVIVAKEALQYGNVLEPNTVETVRWPAASLPEGVFHDTETLFPDNNERPRFVLRTMEAGEAILSVKVTAPGEGPGLISRISKGMRAFALRVDVSSGVSGFLRPGDRVDIYWTGLPPGGRRGGGYPTRPR